jgi:hypothetical protein
METILLELIILINYESPTTSKIANVLTGSQDENKKDEE